MKKFIFWLLFVIAAITFPFVPVLLGGKSSVSVEQNLPWQIEVLPNGKTRVFGLVPGESSLKLLVDRFGPDNELAIVAAPGELGALEVYFNQVSLGFVMAKLIVTVDASEQQLSAFRDRALKAEWMESATKKITISPVDQAAALTLPIKSISVIPTVNLDERVIVDRFGEPGERLVVSESRVHYLYPDKGLDIVLDKDGKELLQYVAPADFQVLRDPLREKNSEK